MDSYFSSNSLFRWHMIHDHKEGFLSGTSENHLEKPMESDIIRILDDELIFDRTGTHIDLFGV